MPTSPSRAQLPGVAGAGTPRRRDDHRRRADPLRAARGRRTREGAVLMLFGEGPRRARPAAHRAGPRHALAPRPGVLPRRLDRPRATRRPRPPRCARPRRRPASTRPASRCSRRCRSCGCRRATSRSRRCWAGGASESPVGVVDPAEVHAVYRVPIEELLDPAHRVSVRHPSGWTRPGVPDRRRQGPDPVGLHRRDHRPALRLPRLDPALGRERRLRDLPDHMLRPGARSDAPSPPPNTNFRER